MDTDITEQLSATFLCKFKKSRNFAIKNKLLLDLFACQGDFEETEQKLRDLGVVAFTSFHNLCLTEDQLLESGAAARKKKKDDKEVQQQLTLMMQEIMKKKRYVNTHHHASMSHAITLASPLSSLI